MKTVARILAIVGCILCGLLCLAGAVMWVCSYAWPAASNSTTGSITAAGDTLWLTDRFLSQRGGFAVGRITTTHGNIGTVAPGAMPSHNGISRLYEAHYEILALPATEVEVGMDPRGGSLARCLGFSGSWGHQVTKMGSASYVWVGLPYWFVCLLTAPWPVLGVRRIRRRWRQLLRIEQGLCGQCGYDLRGSRDRCPECGAAVAGRLRSAIGNS